MSAQPSAREAVLARVRAALPPHDGDAEAAHGSIQREYQRGGSLNGEQTLELFLDRLRDYDTEIVEVETEAELPGAIAGVLQHAGEQRVVLAPEFPATWLPSGFQFEFDRALPTGAIEGAQAVLTTCEAAVATTGSIFLVHEGAQGRRVLTLLPDHHLCVVRRDQIFETVPQAWEALGENAARPITTISGPSATSDIEMTRIRGVHGPRRLTVILYGPAHTPTREG